MFYCHVVEGKSVHEAEHNMDEEDFPVVTVKLMREGPGQKQVRRGCRLKVLWKEVELNGSCIGWMWGKKRNYKKMINVCYGSLGLVGDFELKR